MMSRPRSRLLETTCSVWSTFNARRSPSMHRLSNRRGRTQAAGSGDPPSVVPAYPDEAAMRIGATAATSTAATTVHSRIVSMRSDMSCSLNRLISLTGLQFKPRTGEPPQRSILQEPSA